jgi:hypothetical protein
MDIAFLDEFRAMAIFCHCHGHSGRDASKTDFQELATCQFTFCRRRFELVARENSCRPSDPVASGKCAECGATIAAGLVVCGDCFAS